MAAEEQSGNGRINVSEDRLRLVISEFRNDLLEEIRKHASVQVVEALEQRVKALELWQAATAAASAAKETVRSGFSAAALAWTTLFVAAIGVVSTLAALKYGG